MIGFNLGLMEADGTVSESLFAPNTGVDLDDDRFGADRGFVSIFVDDRPNYGRAGTRQGASWPNAAIPGPHPVTGEYYANRTLAVLLWTETEIEGADREELHEFSFVQGNRNAASHSFLPAIRIGDEWFVYYVDQAYLRDNVRTQTQLMHMNPFNEFNAETVFSGSSFRNPDLSAGDNGTFSQLYTFTWSESGWTRLVFDGAAGVDSTVGMVLGDPVEGSLPSGAITALGVFSPENIVNPGTLNGYRIDSIRLVAAAEPEPFTSLFAFTYNNEGQPGGRDRPIQAANWTGFWGNDAQPLATGDFVIADLSEGVVNPANDSPGRYRAGFLFVAGRNNVTPNQFLVFTDNLNVVTTPQLPQGGNPSVNPQTDWFSEAPFTDDMGTISFKRLREVTMWTQPVTFSTVDIHVAIQLEGEWYVATQGFSNQTSAWTRHTLNVRSTDWFSGVLSEGSLGVNPANVVSASAMPADAMVTAIGYFINTKDLTGTASGGNGNPTWTRIDSITVLAEAPEGFAPPVITTQPQGAVVMAGGNVELGVEVAPSMSEVGYQWFKDGVEVSGATSAVLNITNAAVSDSGSYTVVVSNAAGSMTSSAAVVEVLAMPAVSPDALSAPAEGGPLSVSVTADGRVSWTVVSNVDFITVPPLSAEGVGSATVTLNVSPNTTVDQRVGTVNVAGVVVTVTQAGLDVSVEIEAGELNFGADGGTSEFLVFATAGYTYTAATTVDWITVSGGPSFTGDNVVEFIVAANASGSNRSGVVSVDGEEFTITQLGRVVDFFPGALPANPELPGAVEIDWLGWAYTVADEGFVWTWTEKHGWWGMFPADMVGESTAYFSWDSETLDWWYIVSEFYPWLYAFNVNGSEPHGWLYFFTHTANPRVFYSAEEDDFLTETELYPPQP